MTQARSDARAHGEARARAETSLAVATLSSGADQAGVRLYNERLLLSLVRRFGQLSKIEVARLTGLSVQSSSAIMNRLSAEGLLKREAPLRGRVGQPTVPVSLDPDGAYSFGLKIGRRSLDLVLIDFLGHIRTREHQTFAYPTPELTIEFVKTSLPRLTNSLTADGTRKIAGLGIAAPFQLWSWESEVGAPAGAMEGWRDFAIAEEIGRLCPYPITLCNDATSACAAEFFLGDAWRERDFLYFFVGFFLGGGLVLDGALYMGRTGNAGALGSMPISAPDGGGSSQLIAWASLYQLEKRLEAAGRDPAPISSPLEDWSGLGEPLDKWIEDAAYAIAQASVAAASVIDVAAIVIDGAMPEALREALRLSVAARLETLDRRGLSDFKVLAGVVGPDACEIGAAALPLIKGFARDREVLLKDGPSELG